MNLSTSFVGGEKLVSISSVSGAGAVGQMGIFTHLVILWTVFLPTWHTKVLVGTNLESFIMATSCENSALAVIYFLSRKNLDSSPLVNQS